MRCGFTIGGVGQWGRRFRLRELRCHYQPRADVRGIGYLVATFTFLLSMSCASSSNPAPPASVTVGQFTGTWFNDDTTSVLEQVVVSNAGNSITSVFFDKCVQNPSPIDCETFVANGGFNGSFVPALYV